MAFTNDDRCRDKAEPDEPVFTLLGRDRHAPTLVWLWSELREIDKEDPKVVAEAQTVVLAMMKWQKAHGRQCVGIGQAVLGGVLALIRAANAGKEIVVGAVEAAGEGKKVLNCPTGVDVVRAMLAATDFGPETPPAA